MVKQWKPNALKEDPSYLTPNIHKFYSRLTFIPEIEKEQVREILILLKSILYKFQFVMIQFQQCSPKCRKALNREFQKNWFKY